MKFDHVLAVFGEYYSVKFIAKKNRIPMGSVTKYVTLLRDVFSEENNRVILGRRIALVYARALA